MSDLPSEGLASDGGRSGERPVYSIGAIARMLGVDVAVLRAWEERYAIVVPARSRGGQRLYSRDDLEHLRFVVSSMEDGIGAGDAHRLLVEEMRIADPHGPVDTAERAVVILLAERDRFAAELAEYLLRTEGYDVCIAFSPDEAERLQRERSPDLVVVELMIDGGGLQLCQRLSQVDDLALLAVSALNLADEAIHAGAAAFLTKPIAPLQFVSTIRDLLGQSHLTRVSRTKVT